MAFSFFFRDYFVLERLAELIAKDFIGYKDIKIWDAGCALGQEPYTLAILLSEKLGYFTFKKVRIIASDIDEMGEFEKTITQAIYPYQDLARIPQELFQKYFQKISDNQYQIVDEIKNRVVFRKHNLLDFQPVDTGFASIVCKNVLLHFTSEERVRVVEMFYQSMLPGAYLAMEQTQKLPTELADKFALVSTDVNIYRKIL